MQLVPLAQTCRAGGCPTVFRTEDGDVVVQGYAVPAPQAPHGVPAGEALVRIPRELLVEAARQLARD